MAIDFGDAPDTYGTSLARNGARSYILPNFHLGNTEPDAEVDGIPTLSALGDNATGTNDEDGVSPCGGAITPGPRPRFRSR